MSAVTIIAIGAIIEPTVAGVIGAARALETGAKVVGSIGSSGSSNQGNSHKRDISDGQIEFLFKPCFRSSKINQPLLSYDTETKTADITNLSVQCMEAFDVYMEEISLEEFDPARVRKTSPNSVQVDNIPHEFLFELETEFSSPSPIPTTRPAN